MRPVRKTGSIKRVLTIADGAAAQASQLDDARRKLLADWCKIVDSRLKGEIPSPPAALPVDPVENLKLSPRMREILQRLLKGDSEKQIALQLKISTHTVHTHVKKLHRVLGVSSRGELLARFVPSSNR